MIRRVYFMVTKGDKGTNTSCAYLKISWFPDAIFVYGEMIDQAQSLAQKGETVTVVDFRRVQ